MTWLDRYEVSPLTSIPASQFGCVKYYICFMQHLHICALTPLVTQQESNVESECPIVAKDWVFKAINAYPWRTLRYTDASRSRLGWYEVIMMISSSVKDLLTKTLWLTMSYVLELLLPLKILSLELLNRLQRERERYGDKDESLFFFFTPH